MYSKQNKIFIIYHFPLFFEMIVLFFKGMFFEHQTYFREAKRVILG